jgi:hypothetical protein
MNLTIFIVAAALLALVQVLRITVGRRRHASKNTSLTLELQPLDLEAFHNLANPLEDAYLRLHLPAWDYLRVRHARLQAMSAYVRVASHNAAILAQIGQGALMQKDARRSEAARQLVEDAFRLRRNAFAALGRIYVAMAWPASGSAVAPFQQQYLKVGTSAMLFGRLQDPDHAARFSVAIQ